jgi:hypothetical protein
MGAGGILILIGVIIVIAVLVMVYTGNVGWLGRKGSDPAREISSREDGEPESGGQPRHTRVDLEQNREDEPRGEPVDRVP